MTFVRDIIREFDGTDETIKLQRELIEALEGMATAKGEIFKLQIQEDLMNAGTGSNFTIPIESITNAKFYVRAYASENTDQITTAATEIITDFVRGGDANVIKEHLINGFGIADIAA